MNLSRYDVMSSFGTRNPFSGPLMETADLLRIRKLLRMAVADRGLLCVSGERGIGKSVSVLNALEQMGARTVRVWSLDKKRLLIGDVEVALIHELSDEPPRRWKELRSLQLRRILGEASRRREVVLVIEEAHTLHHMTLRALKALRELAWMGKDNLLTCVLIGQADALTRPGLSEVRLRGDTINMDGLTPAEAARYLDHTLNGVFDPQAVEGLSRSAEGRNFLDLQEAAIRSMAGAMAAGRDTVTGADVAGAIGQAEKPAKREKPKAKANNGLAATIARHKETAEGRKVAI